MNKAIVHAVSPRLLIRTPPATTGVPGKLIGGSAYTPSIGDEVLVELVARTLYVVGSA